MTEYLSTVLRTLERIYRFRSSQLTAPVEIELGVPITLVNDVSRMAQYGSGIGPNLGFFIMHMQNTHTVNGTLNFEVTPTAPTQSLNTWPLGYDPDKFQVWIIRAWMDATDRVDFGEGGCYVTHSLSSIGPAGAAAVQVARDNVMHIFSNMLVGSGGFPGLSAQSKPTQQSNFTPIPLLQKNDGAAATIGIATTSQTGGTVSIDLNILLWLGVKGATPPGMA